MNLTELWPAGPRVSGDAHFAPAIVNPAKLMLGNNTEVTGDIKAVEALVKLAGLRLARS